MNEHERVCGIMLHEELEHGIVMNLCMAHRFRAQWIHLQSSPMKIRDNLHR